MSDLKKKYPSLIHEKGNKQNSHGVKTCNCGSVKEKNRIKTTYFATRTLSVKMILLLINAEKLNRGPQFEKKK